MKFSMAWMKSLKQRAIVILDLIVLFFFWEFPMPLKAVPILQGFISSERLLLLVSRGGRLDLTFTFWIISVSDFECRQVSWGAFICCW